MLSKEMLEKLNHQIVLEAYSSNFYLQMSAWCNLKSYEGAASFLYAHAEEERGHMTKLFNYIVDTGNLAIVGTIKNPPAEYSSLKDVFTETLKHEQIITIAINELVDFALTNKDYSSFDFLQWYVAEQHEEEKLFNSILDKIAIVGDDGRGLLFVDKEIGAMIPLATGIEQLPK